MANKNKDSKWEGKSIAELNNIKAEQLWPLFEDFCTFHKWIPGLDSEKCHYVEGDYGESGLIRCNAFTEQSSSILSNDTDKPPIKWCTEKLLLMDPIERTLSYEIIDNNLGLRSYVGNIKVVEADDGGCKIEWWFVADPAEGMRLEELRGFVESSLKALAEGMGNYISHPIP